MHLSRSLVRKTRTSTARSATFAEAAERPNSQLYDHRKVLPFRNSIQISMPVGLPVAAAQSLLCSVNKKGEVGIRPLAASLLFSYAIPFRVDARKNMRQNHIQSKNVKLFRKLLTAIQTARRSLLAAVALGMAASASFSPGTAYAQEYPWCVSRESYLYCFVSGRPLASEAARSIRVCFSRT